MFKFGEALAVGDARRDRLLPIGVSVDRSYAIDADHSRKKASDT